MQRLRDSIQFLKNVGPKRARSLQNLNIYRVFDLFWHIPREYDDFTQLQPIAQLKPEDNARIRATVLDVQRYRTNRGFQVLKAALGDESGEITGVWFNQNFLFDKLKINHQFIFKGRVKFAYNTPELNVSEILPVHSDTPSILPIYSLTANISNLYLRKLIKNLFSSYLHDYPDIIHPYLQKEYNISSIETAWQNIHFPQNRSTFEAAKRRLILEELFLLRYFMQPVDSNKAASKDTKPLLYTKPALRINLPFKLTNAQKKVIKEIYHDMDHPHPMNRLLQGDVGSGKTAVAASAIAKAVANGYQAAIMVPTEILARQHHAVLQTWFADADISIALLTSSTPTKAAQITKKSIANGYVDIIVGTHALIQSEVDFKNLALVVVDEQHRFGVRQRALLQNKAGNPDVLVMTATPIPRTLALTFYGQLSISVIDNLPHGRRPIKTKYLDYRSREQAYEFVRKKILEGGQAYVVCPLIEESEILDLQAAESIYQELSHLFANTSIKIGLLHGRLSTEEKQSLMDAFKSGNINLIVSTTVVEVGIDVPNANVMLIEQAERFGLSQLHQLRGRVGRGTQQSYCILLSKATTASAQQRLKAMESTQDGFELADIDLTIRGPGEFWGVKQHGLAQLKMIDFTRDHKIIEKYSPLLPLIFEKLPDSQIMVDYLKLKFTEHEIANN